MTFSDTIEDWPDADAYVLVGKVGLRLVGQRKVAKLNNIAKHDGRLTFESEPIDDMEPEQMQSLARAIKVSLCGDKPKPCREMSTYEEVIDFLERNYDKDVAVDFETDGLVPFIGGILIIGFATDTELSWLTFDHYDTPFTKPERRAIHQAFRKFWDGRNGGHRIAHNLRYEQNWAAGAFGCHNTGRYRDTILEKWLDDENTSHSLDYVSIHVLNTRPYWLDLPDKSTLASARRGLIGPYCAMDCHCTYGLALHYAETLTPKQKELAATMVGALPAIRSMERLGLHVSKRKLNRLRRELVTSIEEQETKLARSYPDMNWASAPQVRKLLFDDLGLTTDVMTKSGQASTGTDSLGKLVDRHPVVRHIIDIREKRACVNNVLDVIAERLDADSKIHTSLNMPFTKTGRLSSSGPNLQNIKKNGPERQIFVSRFGRSGAIVQADYKHHELRFAAIGSRDGELISIFRSGRDPHDETARDCKIERAKAKSVNFSYASGVSPKGLVHEFGFTLSEAKRLQKLWFKKHYGVRMWHESIKRGLRAKGYVENVFGRRRHLPDIWSEDWRKSSRATKQGLNFPFQGGGADLLYVAKTRVWHALQNYESKMVLVVHDSIVVDCLKREMTDVCHLLERCMTDFSFIVPLAVDVEVKETL